MQSIILQHAHNLEDDVVKLFMYIILGLIIVGIVNLTQKKKQPHFIDIDTNNTIKESHSSNKSIEAIHRHNEHVAYNESSESWLGDIFMVLLFFPSLCYILYRRSKYRKRIEEPEDFIGKIEN